MLRTDAAKAGGQSLGLSGRVAAWTVVIALSAFALAVPALATADEGDLPDELAGLPWPQALPALPSSTDIQPHPVPGCDKPEPKCIRKLLKNVDALLAELGCDHRAPFIAFARQFQAEILRAMEDGFFDDDDWMPTYVNLGGANRFVAALQAYDAGQPVPLAYQIAFDAAATGETTVFQDVVLGVNAHSQNDMPFATADQGLRRPDGSSRKPDHDRMNQLVQRIWDSAWKEVAQRYDPLLTQTGGPEHPLARIGGLQMNNLWREGVWRNAERLVAARTPEEREVVAQSIEAQAGAWAAFIAAPQVPGTRAQRDAYCQTHLAAP